MNSRRSFLALLSFAGVALAFPAQAFEFHPYNPSVVQKAIASGEPVVVHVFAPWCLQCHAQASILDGLKNDTAYGKITFFRVDYDNQKDVVFLNLGAHPPRLWPQDIDLTHRLWLELSGMGPGAKLHHRDIVGVALRRMSQELHSERKAEVVEDVQREVSGANGHSEDAR